MNADPDFDRVLDQALDALAAGQGRDTILARFAAHADSLAPLLAAAEDARATLSAPVPAPDLARGRRRFIQAAKGPAWPTGWLAGGRASPLRLALAALALLLLITVGVGAASADALPGDALYPIKRVVEDLRLAATPGEAREAYADTLRARRRLEAARAAATGREASVTFEGSVENAAGDRLVVTGVEVLTPAGTTARLGDHVFVAAHTLSGVIIADRIEVLRPGLAVPTATATPARPTLTPPPARWSATPTPERTRPATSPTRRLPIVTQRSSATPTASASETPRPSPTFTPERATATPVAPSATLDRPAAP